MASMHLFRHKNFLFFFLLVLGLQFCYPAPVRTGDPQQVAIGGNFIKDASGSELDEKAGHGAILVFVAAFIGVVHGTLSIPYVRRTDNLALLDLLSTSGYFPSAP